MEKLAGATVPDSSVMAAAATSADLAGDGPGGASFGARPARIVLTVGEAGELLGIGRTLMYSLVSSGAVESITIGRLRRVPVDAVSAYVESLRASSPNDAAA
jgi:excisionase family DNA binding protein